MTYFSLYLSPLLNVTSSPLLPIQCIPYIPHPGTWAGGWVPTCASMLLDEWPDIACPSGGRTTGPHTFSERPLGFASLKAHGHPETGPFDRQPGPECVLEPTARCEDPTQKESRGLMYNPLDSVGLYSRAGTHGGISLWGKSIGPWRVGQAGGSGTTERCPPVALVCPSGGDVLFSACVTGPGIRAVGKYCAPATSGRLASCE